MSMQPDLSPYATYENMSQLNVKPTTVVKEQTWPVLHHTDKIQRPNKTGFPRVMPLHKYHPREGKPAAGTEYRGSGPGKRSCGPSFPN